MRVWPWPISKTLNVSVIFVLQIEEYQRETPGIYGWEIRERLLKKGVCDRFNVPTISAINRMQQRLLDSASVHLLTNNSSCARDSDVTDTHYVKLKGRSNPGMENGFEKPRF